MPSDERGRIALDDLMEAATAGVLRALEARNVSARDFSRENGLFIKVEVTAGAWPDPTEPEDPEDPENPSA
jgi:hypothetical protein